MNTSKWLGNDREAKRQMVFAIFDSSSSKIEGLQRVWGFVTTARIPTADVGNIIYWLLEDRNVTEQELHILNSTVERK